MKRCLIFLFLLFAGQLFCDVGFQYQYSLPKYDQADEYSQLLLFDMDNDGSDEIIVTYTNYSIFRIVIYDQTGAILETREYTISENYQYQKIHLIRLFNTLYLIININEEIQAGNQITCNCILQAINWETNTIIDEISYLIGQYSSYYNTSYDFSTHLIKDKVWGSGTYIFLGISKHYSWGDEIDDGNSTTSKLYQVLFNGNSLNSMHEFSRCGTSIKFLDGSTYFTSGRYYSSSSAGMGQTWDSTNAYYIKELSYFNATPIDTLLAISGTRGGDFMYGSFSNHFPAGFCLLKQNPDPWDYGYPLYYNIRDDEESYDVFANYDQNSNSLIWENGFSEIRDLGYNIKTSSLIDTDQGNQFVMYFGSKSNSPNYLEIRDLTSGQYVLAQIAPFIPDGIRTNEDNDILYFQLSDSGFNVYETLPISFPSIIPRFTVSDTVSYSPLAVSFSEYSYGDVTSWAWDFDNNGIVDSNEQNPEWTFYEAGFYSVSLTVSDGINTEVLLKENLIHILPPEASFSIGTDNGIVPLTVQFTDTSIENIVSWEWDFNNDGIIDSNEQNPEWIYDETGTFSVKLSVSDGTNTDEYLMENCIEVIPFIIAFNSSQTNSWIPLYAQFHNNTQGIVDSVAWDLNGDGIIDSNENDPLWIYEEPGWYDVSLTISNSFATETLTKPNYIHSFFAYWGDITEDTVWSADSLHIMGTADILIEEGATLTIQPGVTILIPMSVTFNIQGNIIAEGTENDSIYFIPYYNTHWNSINFDETPADADSSKFSFCVFKNSEATTHNTSTSQGGTFYFDDFSKAKIFNSAFYGNSANEGGGIYLKLSSPTVENCTFYNNTADKGAAIYSYTSTFSLKNCNILSNNSDWGAIYFLGGNHSILNSIIANNDSYCGGGLYCWDVNTLSITNCVFWGNDASHYNYGSHLYLEFSSPIVENSIFWHPLANYSSQIYLADNDCLPHFEFCNIQHGISSLYGPGFSSYPDSLFQFNIDAEPEFISPTEVVGITSAALTADWKLQSTSPCIDAGNPTSIYNDPADPQNPLMALYPSLGTIVNDLGAYGGPQTENWYFTDLDEPEIQLPSQKPVLSNYPNPFNPTTTISFSIEQNEPYELSIYNLKGQKVRTFSNHQISKSRNHQIVWDGKDQNGKSVSSGIYYYSLMINGKKIASRKCLLLK